MAKYLIEETTLTSIADAIRSKDETTDKIQVSTFSDRIKAIPQTASGNNILNSLIDRNITQFSSETITSIGNSAFMHCGKLTTVDLPAVTRIGQSAFSCCYVLNTADFSAVINIGNSAFDNCHKLTTANFPAATNIDGSAFSNCQLLTTINFPVATTIGDHAFFACYALTTIKFPAVTNIYSRAFVSCRQLTTADFPVATSINSEAFQGCSNLTAFILRNPDAVCTLNNANIFNSTPIASGTGYIYVPKALVDSYKAATNWTTYADQIRAIEDYPDICGG